MMMESFLETWVWKGLLVWVFKGSSKTGGSRDYGVKISKPSPCILGLPGFSQVLVSLGAHPSQCAFSQS